MAGELLVQEDPSLGVAILMRAHTGKTGTVPNAWEVLVDWGFDGDAGKALQLLASKCGGEDEARAILTASGISV